MKNCVLGIALLVAVCIPAHAELIRWSEPVVNVLPGESVPGLALLDESTTPLFGYSLDIEIVSLPGATGMLTVDTAATNFFEPRNLITAGGAIRDPIFSLIQSTAEGAFISTNTADLSTVAAESGINDVLAQVFFIASGDAIGDFEVRFGGGTALSDGQGFPVEHTTQTLRVTVIPTPGAIGLLLGAAVYHRRRR